MKEKNTSCSIRGKMIVVDHEKFLSTRFDLVIRWYFLEKAGFDIQRAGVLTGGEQYDDLRNAFATLLTIDVTEGLYVADKVRRASVKPHEYGRHVAGKLFLPIKNWSWIGERMIEGEKWIRKNPYSVRVNGLGLSVKRFMLSLKHKRRLYWEFQEKGKASLSLWKQFLHKQLLNSNIYAEIEKAERRMVVRMKELEFFSAGTYMGKKNLFKIYMKEKS